MASTYAERLQLVRDAIDQIIASGQAVEFDGKSYTEVNMSHLIELEKRYEIRAAREAQGVRGMRVRYGVAP